MFQEQNQVNIKEARPMVIDFLLGNMVPFLRSSPALGKSSLAHQIAQEFNLLVIDLRLSQCDPTDLNGFPKLDGDIATYVPMDTFPLEGQDLPVNPVTQQPYEGWLLFLDEFNSAPQSVQAAAYKLVLDRMVGQHKLNSNVRIMCAGNLDTDGAITNAMSSAMVSRVQHMHMRADKDCFVEYAEKNNWSTDITSFLEFRPESFYTFDAGNPDQVYAAPRPWEKVNTLLTKVWKGKIPAYGVKMLAGCVGEGVAAEMDAFLTFNSELPKMADIAARPTEVPIPANAGVRYALTGALASYATAENLESLAKYIERLPADFIVICYRSMMRRSPQLRSHKAVFKFCNDFADIFFD